MKLSKSESSEQNTLKVVKNQPLAVSEIIDEYDRAGTSYAFEEYASAMRGMKALVKDKNVQNKSQFMQFKVGNSSPSIAYYLRTRGPAVPNRVHPSRNALALGQPSAKDRPRVR